MMDCRLGIYEKAFPSFLTWEEKLRAAKEAGYDFLEISIDETDEKICRLDMTCDEKNELCSLMRKYEIYIESMCLSGHRKFSIGSENIDIRNKGMEIMRKAILFARDIGIRIIQIAGYDVYYEPSNEKTLKLFEKNLSSSVEYAAQYGVMLAFETMETEFINTVSKAMVWIQNIRSPYLMIYPDSGNITNAALGSKSDVLKDLDSGEGFIAAVHLKESMPGKFREIPYGSGHVPFKKIIKKSYKIGVRRYLAEFWYTGRSDWETEVWETHRFFKKFMK